MLRRLRPATPILLAASATAILATGCILEPPPTDGYWYIQRTVRPVSEECWQLSPGDLNVKVDVSAEPGHEIVVTEPGVSLYEGGDRVVTDTQVVLTTDEYAFSAESPGANLPIVIRHDMHIEGERLVGTATAQGDGDNIGCSYTIDLDGGQPL